MFPHGYLRVKLHLLLRIFRCKAHGRFIPRLLVLPCSRHNGKARRSSQVPIARTKKHLIKQSTGLVRHASKAQDRFYLLRSTCGDRPRTEVQVMKAHLPRVGTTHCKRTVTIKKTLRERNRQILHLKRAGNPCALVKRCHHRKIIVAIHRQRTVGIYSPGTIRNRIDG